MKKQKMLLPSSFSALAMAAVLSFSSAVWSLDPGALPTGAEVAAGGIEINQSGTQMDITQSTDRAIVNWQTFDIGSQAQVNFNQPSASSATLNRISSADPSQIFGQLTANGQVFLVNPAGIIFSPDSHVDVGGVVASTMQISDDDFMSGVLEFDRDGSSGSVINQGDISSGGLVALLAPEVINDGVITAQLGSVVMAAGEKVVLTMDGDAPITVAVDPAEINTLVENRHMIIAQDGTVIMAAAAANDLFSSTINVGGSIEAMSITVNDGRIKLNGADTIDGVSEDSSGTTSGGVVGCASCSTDSDVIVGPGTVVLEGPVFSSDDFVSIELNNPAGGAQLTGSVHDHVMVYEVQLQPSCVQHREMLQANQQNQANDVYSVGLVDQKHADISNAKVLGLTGVKDVQIAGEQPQIVFVPSQKYFSDN